ncbi:MAG: 5-carboxymethyl-2-hydroxymuconate semialdehyde dehydrogenase [Gammaproteobacteria bacterium]|nr:MAG: 5-carboxymethyl-2-hydroxymuconate semialdehyde dehydrogenase [Gammaproteobacteria bacterium]RLA09437.1 MAG: 5-carboxymethyl-2-hydroxymuconate semialdehyde dehydrogenase [Gammaproteobacteria bacterium]RLA14578.1 MAG: 5-carboxymethyl-2-hydroxymuconate semialdehyde dehydrogenase [Gammaproteobacteria bacterium]
MKEIKHLINGQFVGSASGKMFDDINPATGQLIAKVHEGGKPEVDAAVAAARTALKGPWGTMPVDERMALLRQVAEGINTRAEEFAQAESADNGMPISLARAAAVPRGSANFIQFAEHFKYVATETWEMDGALNYSLRRPLGVIGIISPWNFPLLLSTWKIAPALASGNTVVMKPSEETPMTAMLTAEVINEILPPGVFNVVQGLGSDSAGAALSEHPDVDGITFTGETTTGKTIMRAAADGLKKLSFELGGKNPNIVFADADLEDALTMTLRSSFANQGEVCLCGSRIYVQRPIFDQFVTGLVAKVKANVKVGDPSDPASTMGSLVSKEHFQRVMSFVESAREDGATFECGGKIPDNLPDHLAEGVFLEPTVVTGLTPDCKAQRQEIFGPMVSIVPFDTEEEVLELANDTRYGLGATVWTTNLGTAHRMSAALEAGIIWVNTWFLRDLRTPFGGMKNSGIGREGGVHSLEFYSELKNVCIKL